MNETNVIPAFVNRGSFIELDGRERAQALFDEGSWRELVGPFDRVAVVEVFRRDGVERRFEIGGHIRIGVFIDRNRSRSVLNVDMQQSHAHLRELGQGLNHV